MATDKTATKINAFDVMLLGIQVGDLAYIVTTSHKKGQDELFLPVKQRCGLFT
jgi:hypothetical protein